MPSELLWIVKDSSSERLSQSTRSDESRIRRHVQIQRRNGKQASLLSSAASQPAHGQHDVSKWQTSCNPPTPRISPPLRSSEVYLTDAEARGLEFYIHFTARECSGWQDEHFWNVLVIQACFTNSGIAHALISIGSWHRGFKSPPGSNEATQLSALTSSQWLKTLSYGQMLSSTTYSTSLIHCVVLACLQAHQNDYQDFRLLRSAGAMLQELDMPGRIVSAAEREMIHRQVRPLVMRLQARICTICDLPAALERSAQLHQSRELPRRALHSIPTRFSNLRQARDCLESIFNWAHDHILQYDSSTPTINMHSILTNYINDWHAALPATSPPQSTALLRLSALHGLILIQTCTAPTEMAFDAHVPTFSKMMDTIASLGPPRHSPRGTISFGIDSGLLDIVAFVATRCREPRLRRAAIAWLQTASRTEGDRLSVVSAQIAHAWLQLEEGSLVARPVCAADVPAWNRWKLVRGARYHARSLVRLEFVGASLDGDDAAATRVEVCISEKKEVQNCTVDVGGMPADWGLPDVLIEKCGAAFLEDRETAAYHRVQIEHFYFPIPRI